MKRGIDLTNADPEVALVIRSVLPVFTHESERPERVGTCVLARIDRHSFIVTAAHVIEEAHRSTGRFTITVGGQLVTIHRDRFITPPGRGADIGLIPMRAETVTFICNRGGAFLDAEMMDETEKADGTDLLNTFAHTYFALGFPASRSYSRVDHREKKIHLKTFSVRLTLAPTTEYPEGLSTDNHLLLDYAANEVLLQGRRTNPPMVQGISGGGVFRFSRRAPHTTKLVGILIEYHKNARVMAATRVGVVGSLAREVIAQHSDAFL